MNKLAAQIEQMTPDQFYQFVTALCKAYLDPVRAAGACYCRECKYFDPDENIAPNTGSCSFVEMVRLFDDFCSKGERKEETP